MQHSMCQCFEQWGLPKSIKVDNGKPFGDPQGCSVPVLALWLIGLGIEMIWNRPRNPTDNAKVERMQGTTSKWAEIDKCTSYTQLQTNLDKAAQIQREKYQVKRLNFQVRKQRYAQLWNNSRKYDCSLAFDITRVGNYLSKVMFVRKVNKKGVFNFYAQSVYLGYSHRSKTILLHYDVVKNIFVIEEQDNKAIAHLGAENFDKEHVVSLTICQHKYVKCRNFMSF